MYNRNNYLHLRISSSRQKRYELYSLNNSNGQYNCLLFFAVAILQKQLNKLFDVNYEPSAADCSALLE